MTLAFSLSFSWLEFVIRHPGLVLVLLGVAGEVICDWKDMGGRLARAKRISAILLVVGLAIEFIEAAESDRDVAFLGKQTATALERAGIAEKEAGKANERAESIESTNLLLRKSILELEAKTEFRKINPLQKHTINEDLTYWLAGQQMRFGIFERCKVFVVSKSYDIEAKMFATQITDLLRSHYFEVETLDEKDWYSPIIFSTLYNVNTWAPISPGLSFVTHDPIASSSDAILKAFEEADLGVKGYCASPIIKDGILVILVGKNPR